MKWLFRDPPRDPALGSALRELETVSRRDDSELRERIVSVATPHLARLRTRPSPWWEWISRWTPVAVPLGLAASLAAGLILPQAEDVGAPTTYSAETAADSTLFLAAYSETPAGSQIAAGLVAPEEVDWLLEQAVTR